MGEKGSKFRSYSEEWKQNAVQMYYQQGMSYEAIAKTLGMPSSTQVKRWENPFRINVEKQPKKKIHLLADHVQGFRV
jgi:transposase-like protein